MFDDEDKPIPLGPMARRIRVTAKWLEEEAKAGRVPHLRAGTRYLFYPPAVEAVLCERASQFPTPETAE